MIEKDKIYTEQELEEQGFIKQNWLFGNGPIFKSEVEEKMVLLEIVDDTKYRVFFIVDNNK